MNNKTRATIGFYMLASKLKTTIRTGWKIWEISAPRLESVAEHIYGAQMLAIAIISEYKIDVDLRKVILMLAIHELGETIIGDITPWDGVSKQEKAKIELAAVENVLSKLSNADEIRELFVEFENGQTPEAKFCRQVDKLEADLQAKQYDETGFVDYSQPRSNKKLDERRMYHIKKGNDSFGKAWTDNEIEAGIYSGEFLAIAEFVRDHKISEGRDDS